MIRCKFTCVSVTKRKAWSGASGEFVFDAEFQAVTKHNTAVIGEAADENAAFWAATPSGTLKVATVRQDHFEVGRDYFLDLTPAP